MKKIRALIVEDEKSTRAVLVELINQFCPKLEIVGEATSVKNAIDLIDSCNPELVFLDIKMGDGTGFEVLEQIAPINFEIIFTTAYEDYALKAIKYSCLDYLIKPIDINELTLAVNKVKIKVPKSSSNKNATNFINEFDKSRPFDRIGLPTKDGVKYVETANIIYCKADGPYTHIYFNDNNKILISKTLKHFESLLSSESFKRSHRSFIVNIKYIERYERVDGGCLVLKNGKVIPISRRLKASLLENLR